MSRIYSTSLNIVFACLLSACGGGGSSDPDSAGRSGSNKAHLTLSITDAPVDYANAVVVEFTGLSIKPVNKDAIVFTYDTPKRINILGLYGTRTEVLLDNQSVPSGEYEWIRLAVNASNDGILDSYIELKDGSTPELDIPSGDTRGLQITNIGRLEPNHNLSFTIDFDLAKSIVLDASGYKLKPVLRLVDNSEAGSISGTIDPALLVDLATPSNCSDSDPSTGNAIYVFANNTTPDDIDGQYPDPITVARVVFNSVSGDYEYEIGFLPEGRYTLAFTCQSDLDDPEANDNLVFRQVINDVRVEADNDDDEDDNDEEDESHSYR